MKISLRAARVNAGLRQSDVAVELGVGKRTVVSWEQGKHKPRGDAVLALCQLYGRKFEEIEWEVKS